LGTRQLFSEKSAKELLEDFVQSGSQEPYEEIVRRYAAMVYGVCLRVTHDKHDAEDATQAVFLSLALQAKTQREINYVGPWLQKVAHRLALDVKKSKTRRRKREEKLADQARTRAGTNGFAGSHNGRSAAGNGFFGGNGHRDPADGPGAEELKQILLEELNQLPAKYRMPLVMHYFGGLSREEMAEELGCNPSTLGVRVHRGKAMLGTRLTKRGITLSAIALAVLLEHAVKSSALQPIISASASASGASSMLYASSAFGSNGAFSASARVLAIARTAMRSIAYAKLKFAIVMLLVFCSAAITSGTVLARYVDLSRIHLPVPLDLSRWIEPLFKSLLPVLRADSSSAGPVEAPIADGPDPLNLAKVDLPAHDLDGPADFPGGEIDALSNDPPIGTAVGASDPALAQKPEPDPKLNQVAQATLNPPRTAQPADAKPVVHQEDPAGKNRDNKPNPSGAAADGAQPVLASAAAGDVYLGAGGGGGGGKPEVYTLPPGGMLHTQNLVVGESSSADFKQLGGFNQIDNTLTIGHQRGSSGSYTLSGGTLSAMKQVIGDAGDGAFIQLDGVNISQQSITIGRANGSSGKYQQADGKTVVINPDPNSDPGNDAGGLHIGEKAGSNGSYILTGGVLSADPQIIGKAGKGTLTQAGGTNTTGAIDLGAQSGSSGTYQLVDGQLVFTPRPTNKPSATINIGGEGHGTFNLGNAQSTGNIYQVGGGGSVVVRGKPTGDGSLIGWGKVNLQGGLANNGQVVADGYNRNRTLDLSSFQWVTSSFENSRNGGTAGWFARRKGSLLLPPIPMTAGSSTGTFGEDQFDPMLDLVNSTRFHLYGIQHAGSVSVALQSPLRDDIPALPQGHQFIGIWKFAADDLGGFTSADLEVRYDDALASAKGLDESILKLWVHEEANGQWLRLDHDPSFYRDTTDHILGVHAPGNFDYFAVSAPEPGSALLVVIGAGVGLLRRKRREPRASTSE
jgi:RNA polymerase sigma factor (sigma-70 family)